MGSSILGTLRRVARQTLSSVDPFRSGCRLFWGAALLGLAGLAPVLVHAQVDIEESFEAGEDQPYQVIDGKVDPGTYNGYRRYQSHYHACHGQDGATVKTTSAVRNVPGYSSPLPRSVTKATSRRSCTASRMSPGPSSP